MNDVKVEVIIDAMNSVSSKPSGINNIFGALKVLTIYNNVVKCFNSIASENMENPNY